ncbi:polysaccharide biosynthesis protein GumH [Sphingomonas oleivorans]|uniref:Polysaccharide biosynthesis protein GumH n=1 Tax=Sphingomonas oleivorans TaxID=1735121 RepID=A0A2T5FYV4_9SPHN|nr:WecB/TagA/CpsF family glycosyltransferase [Sphingomonas oleivorans]PTQ11790.1 polysaccharide biosynthesis protein GumH [Sphingomonas oleivorans]
MQIAHICRQYAPGVGGLENFLASLAQQQRRAGHDVRVITLNRIFNGDGKLLSERERLEGVDVVRIPFFGSKRYPVAPSILRHIAPSDVVHVHGVDFFVDFLSLTRLLHRKPLILSTHGGFFHTGFARSLKSIYFQSVTRMSLKGFRGVIASSLQDRDMFEPICSGKVVAIENGVDTEKFAGLGAPTGRTMIYFGRIAPNKEILTLIRWFSRLREREPGWRLIIAGKPMGLSFGEIRQLVEQTGTASAIELHETPDDAQLARLIARSNVYASASSYEGFGLAAVEAVAAGLYPVLSDIPAFRRTQERLGFGTLADFRDPDRSLPPFLRELRQFQDEGRTRIDPAAVVRPFAWSAAASNIEKIYRRTLGTDVRRIGPVEVEVHSQDSALSRIRRGLDRREPLMVAFCNAHTVNSARADRRLVDALRRAMVLNDGFGLDIASAWLYGRKFPANLNGTDLIPALFEKVEGTLRVFLVGSPPGIAERAADVFARCYPNVRIVGTQHGFFDTQEDGAVARRIRAAAPDLVLVGMGHPRQEIWAANHLETIGSVVMCVGALLDFTAGAVKRAPEWIRAMRMEWAYRLLLEPRRMARRYLTGNLAFLLAVARQGVAGMALAESLDVRDERSSRGSA